MRKMNEKSALELNLNELTQEKFEKLALETEKKLLRNIDNKKKQEKIINANMRYVISVAKKYARNENELTDLIQVGNIALFESFNSFDYDEFAKHNCNRFISYAGRRIFQKIELEAKKHIYSVSVTNCKAKEISKFKKVFNSLQKDLNEKTKVKIAAEKLGIKFKSAMTMYLTMLESSSLEYEIDNDGRTFSSTIADERISTENDAINNVLLEQLRLNLPKLSRNEEEVVTLAYGLDGEEPLNYSQIAEKLGYTREGIRLIHNRAIAHLRESMAA